jgi:predicted RecA/RadA family phage recombinase
MYMPGYMGPVAEYTTTEVVYEGSAVGENSSLGTVRNFTDGDAFLGFALRQAASGAQATVVTSGYIRLTVTGGATATLGAAVYATTSDTFSTTDSGSDTSIGHILQSIDTSTDCWVHFEGYQARSI